MLLNNQISKIFTDLNLYDSKIEGVFKTTHLDKLVHNAFTSPHTQRNGLGYYPEQMVLSYMLGTLFNVESQPDLISKIRENEFFSKACGFNPYIPVQSTFSRAFNNELYHNPLDLLIYNIQKLIGLKKVHKYSDINPIIMKAISKGYLPTSIDGSLVSLSEKRFNYATRGYSGSKKQSVPGAKLFLSLDAGTSIPINYDIGTGKTHESSVIDPLVKEINNKNLKNFEISLETVLTLLILSDKGFWKQKRFQKWNEEQISFIIPLKRNSFRKLYPNLNEELNQGNENREWTVNIPGSATPLRIVRGFTGRNTKKKFLLLTNVWNMTIKDIIELYKQRWTIETVFKWYKEYLNLENPLGTSWNAFIFHTYCVIALWTILLYFLTLLGIPVWQENLQNIRRQLINGEKSCWDLSSLGISLALLDDFLIK